MSNTRFRSPPAYCSHLEKAPIFHFWLRAKRPHISFERAHLVYEKSQYLNEKLTKICPDVAILQSEKFCTNFQLTCAMLQLIISRKTGEKASGTCGSGFAGNSNFEVCLKRVLITIWYSDVQSMQQHRCRCSFMTTHTK